MEKIKLNNLQGEEEIEFQVIEQTRINNTNYLLVTEGPLDTEEETAYILKDLSKEEDIEAVYEFVEDDEEIESVSKIFAQLLDDIDLEA